MIGVLTSLLPVRKIVSLIWRSHSRHTRLPGTVHECIEDSSPSREGLCRSWLVLILGLSLVYFLYRRNAVGEVPFIKQYVEDIMVAKQVDIHKQNDASIFPNRAYMESTETCEVNMTGRGIANQTFLFYIHPFLIEQNLEYQIFVIEQSGHEKFNKGRLFNAGFKQSLDFGRWHCLVLHEATLVPLDERILYTCPTYPRHMSATILGVKTRSSDSRFGGVTAWPVEHYQKVNGYSNLCWVGGGEDFDMFWRIRLEGLPVSRYDKHIAEYAMLPSPQEIILRRNYTFYSGFRKSPYKNDGLSTLNYRVVSVKLRHLFTHIVVEFQFNKTKMKY